MDIKSELWKAKWLIAAFITAIICFYYSYEELAYLLRGQVISADVERIMEVKYMDKSGKPAGKRYFVEYTFSEPDGTRRTGFGYKENDWEISPNVEVQFTPGRVSRSRYTGNTNWILISIFLTSLALTIGFGYRYWKSETPEERRRKWYA